MKKMLPVLFISIAVLIALSFKKQQMTTTGADWPAYAGTKSGNRYSTANQITPANVKQLTVAWTYSTNDKDDQNHSQNQCNPIMLNGVLYGTSPRLKLFALDASTGHEKWVFDPASLEASKTNDPPAYFKVCRGVVYWQDKNGGNKRIFYSAGSKTYAVDAETGKIIESFGKGGYIDLTENLGRKNIGFIAGTTPGIIYKDVLILGARVAESEDAAPGDVRAYDALTGKLRWVFHTIPHPGERNFKTWPDSTAWRHLGGANNWSGMALDEQRGMVYIPLGSIGGDFYGGHRKGSNLYANSLVALDAATGKYSWHYQVVHHDLWDRDLPANPNLITVKRNGKTIDAVAQITKHGFIFMFDRSNGKPIFPIVEKPVPQKALPGEHPWPTQPIPTLPMPFARQHFGPEDVSNIDPETHRDMLAQYRKVKYRTMFSPPSLDGGWIFPGFDGGGEWGGAAVDTESNIMYISNSEMPWAQVMINLALNPADHSLNSAGHAVYNKYCVACHGLELKGNGAAYPSLLNIGKKYDAQKLSALMESGRNMMPSFKQMAPAEKQAILAFLLKTPAIATTVDRQAKEPATSSPDAKPIPYAMDGYKRFLDKNGYPGIKPPWGSLSAVNLTTGRILWKIPLGEYPELTKRGIPITGTELYGGPIVTKGGLVFVAATKDEKIRAFDKLTGKQLWEAQLPAAGYATPATYSIGGKQYVVIACGGGKVGSKSGDSYVCFALGDR